MSKIGGGGSICSSPVTCHRNITTQDCSATLESRDMKVSWQHREGPEAPSAIAQRPATIEKSTKQPGFIE
jgi:hypothetical protein